MDKSVKKYVWLLTAVAVMAGLYLYRPFGLYFLADDFLHIPQSSKNIWLQRNSLRPVGNLSLHIDYLFSQKNALGYHITNLLLHIANTMLVYFFSRLLLQKFMVDKAILLPVLISIFFFTYPFHSETVFWIIGRSGSLGSLFFLAAIICFLKKDQSVIYTFCSLLFFKLALLSYESSWIFLPVVLLFILADGSWQSFKKQAAFLLLVLLLFIGHLFIRIKSTGELLNSYDAASFVQLNFHALIENYIRLFARTFTPPMFSNHHFLLFFSIVISNIALLIFILYKKGKSNLFFIVLSIMWLISYLPYLSIGIDTHGVEGERYLYLPSVFFSIWILMLLYQLFSKKQFMLIVAVFSVVHCVYLYQSRTYYVKAGTITATTIQQINTFSQKEKIYFQHLPQYNKGAVVWRTGLEDAVKWLCNRQPQLMIVSKDKSDEQPIPMHHKVFSVNYAYGKIPQIFSTILLLDKSFKKNYIVKDTAGLVFNPLSDALFIYSDTALNIIH